jgi:hypothetical protein
MLLKGNNMPRDKVFDIARESTMTLMNIQTKKEFDKMYEDPVMGWKIKKYVEEFCNAILKGQQLALKSNSVVRHR